MYVYKRVYGPMYVQHYSINEIVCQGQKLSVIETKMTRHLDALHTYGRKLTYAHIFFSV